MLFKIVKRHENYTGKVAVRDGKETKQDGRTEKRG